MMMKIYDLEKVRGLESKINSSSVASASCEAKSVGFTKAAKNKNCVGQVPPKGILSVDAVLVSTNWNKNDDVFSPEETARAVRSPLFKPCNINHMGRESVGANTTLGVIVDSYPVNDEFEYFNIGEETKGIDFNIVVSCFLWETYFPTAVSEIKTGIDEGQMFVSMECRFDDFGYALKGPDGSVSMLPRNEITAWLTSYLRSYGGDGKVTIDNKNYQIGRWLREINFSGVGFVKNPANPKSIVFENYSAGSVLDPQDFGLDKEIKENSQNSVSNNIRAILWL